MRFAAVMATAVVVVDFLRRLLAYTVVWGS